MLRAAAASAVLVVLALQVGTGPFLAGLRVLDVPVLLAGAALGAGTTLCCAWRWCLVARGLGVPLGLGAATAGYYRSQFLNVTLPGGVLGDVHRGIVHGHAAGDLGRGLRAVVWERVAGQVVQVAVVVVVLVALPSPVSPVLPGLLTVLVLAGVAGWLSRLRPRRGGSHWARLLTAASADVRAGLLGRRVWPGLLVASVLAVAGHGATFLLAARTAGSSAPVRELAPLALVVLVAMAVPVSLAGWGPREGAAAWAFAVAGLGAAQGVTTAVVFGVMVLAASLPGAVLLAARWPGAGKGAAGGRRPGPVLAGPAEVGHG